MLTAFATVLAFVGVAAALILGLRLLGRALRRPALPQPSLLAEEAVGDLPEAAGEPREPRPALALDARFGLIAVVLIGCEGAIAFLVPVAVVLRRWVLQGRGARALLEILAFAGVSLFGVAYAWRKGDLAPARELDPPEKEP